jgi:hypothetical protein
MRNLSASHAVGRAADRNFPRQEGKPANRRPSLGPQELQTELRRSIGEDKSRHRQPLLAGHGSFDPTAVETRVAAVTITRQARER